MATINDMFPSKYLKGVDLKDGPVTATIKVSAVETFKGQSGGEPQQKVVIYFAKALKPLPLNRGNFETLMDLSGSGDSEDFVGVRVELFTIKMTMGGKTFDSVRLRKPVDDKTRKAAPKKPQLPLDEEMNDEIPSFKKSDDE